MMKKSKKRRIVSLKNGIFSAYLYEKVKLLSAGLLSCFLLSFKSSFLLPTLPFFLPDIHGDNEKFRFRRGMAKSKKRKQNAINSIIITQTSIYGPYILICAPREFQNIIIIHKKIILSAKRMIVYACVCVHLLILSLGLLN